MDCETAPPTAVSGARVPRAVVVNDDPTQLRALSILVCKAGMEARAFSGAEAALADMARRAGTEPRKPGACPALVVTDLYMPDLDGWRFCRLLRSPEYEALNHVPILVVSASFSGEAPERISTDLGADAFLPCPLDGRLFVERVQAFLRGERTNVPVRVLIVDEDGDLAGDLAGGFARCGWEVAAFPTVKETPCTSSRRAAFSS